MTREKITFGALAQNRDGVAAIEFAFVLPIFVLVLLGAIEYCRVVALDRKLTLTTRAVTDLTTQYVIMSDADIATVLQASSQILMPYPAKDLTIVLSEVSTDVAGTSTVSWSRALNGTPLQQGSVIALPPGSSQAGASVILSQVSYAYTPIFGSGVVPALTLSDRISMSPRLSATVSLAGT